MKIERVDEFKFMLDGVPYNTGTLVPKYAKIVRAEGVITEAKIGFAYAGTGEEVQKQYTRWQDFTDAADDEFDTFEECALYIADAIATGDGISSVVSDYAAVTQLTNKTTAVESNTHSTTITTVALTDAADASFSFTFTNDKITATSQVLPTVNMNSGNGKAIIHVTPAAGSATVTVTNAGTAAFNSAIKIGLVVI